MKTKPYVWVGRSGQWYVSESRNRPMAIVTLHGVASWRRAMDIALLYVAEPS